MPFSCSVALPSAEYWTNLSPWQIYSTTRIATVISLAIILYEVDVSESTPYDCEVRVLHIYSIYPQSDRPGPKVKAILQFSFGYLSIATSSLLIVLRMYVLPRSNYLLLD
jgi:hypothetical protein